MDNVEGTLIERVTAIDPARQVPLAGAEQTDETLRWVLAQPRESAGVLPSRSRSLRPVAALAATAAVALGGGVMALWPSSGESAFATWEPVPTVLDQTSVAASAAHCPEEVTLPVGEGKGQPEFISVPVDPVIAEKRGDHVFVLLEGEQMYLECIVTETAEGTSLEATFTGVGASRPLDDDRPGLVPRPHDPTSITVLTPGQARRSGDGGAGEGAVTSAYGRAGTDVETIEVTTRDGTRAQATVDNGWWAVWFPDDSPIDHHATVTTAGGHTYTANLHTLFDEQLSRYANSRQESG